jgi:hypothetical protein
MVSGFADWGKWQGKEFILSLTSVAGDEDT